MDKLQDILANLHGQIKSRIGKNFSNELAQAIAYLRSHGVDISPEKAMTMQSDVVDVARSMRKCQNCQKRGAETENCYAIRLVYDARIGEYYRTTGRCKKAQTHLNAQKIAQMASGTGMGRRFMNRRFETFEVTEATRAAYEKCRKFCGGFRPDSTGLMLVGNYGTGKTHLAAAVIAEMLKRNVVGMFVVVPDLLRHIRRSFDNKELSAEFAEFFDMVRTAELLVLDDLGTEKPSDWVREQLFMLINARYENMLPTIVTTNCDMQELADRLGQRIVSRLVEMTDGVQIKSSDYRLRKLGV